VIEQAHNFFANFDLVENIRGIQFNYNIDMRFKGRVSIAIECGGDDDPDMVYYALASHNDITGETGPVLLVK
jgi:hypothetical protein